MNPERVDEIVAAAILARESAYAPYSRFLVGAAILSSSGKIYSGCNVENISYSLTICAERNALSSAVADRERDFTYLAIVADTKEPISPCGACRQVMAEFGNFPVLSLNLANRRFESTVEELLPRAKTGILDHTS